MKRIGIFSILALSIVFSGCATTEKTETPPVQDLSSGADTRGAAAKTAPEPQPIPAAPVVEKPTKNRVHFAFDSSALDDEARAVAEAHAAYLAANPQIYLTLEGHCDERGTREYNLALGERRAQALGRLMRVLGVASDRITISSYGEEKPIDPEHNESAWRQNRRVEIQYKK